MLEISRLRHNLCCTNQPFPASFFKSQQRLLFLRSFFAVGVLFFYSAVSDCNIMRIMPYQKEGRCQPYEGYQISIWLGIARS